jgi:hypothetical protein
LLERLKHRDQYQGARYEIAIAAVFARLGFDIEFLDSKKLAGRHCEFIARHSEKGITVAVEAKSKHRPGVLHFKGAASESDLLKGDIRSLLEKAATQNPGDIPFMIFVDLNAPRAPDVDLPAKPWFSELLDSVDVFPESSAAAPDPFNAIVITNHPFHYDADQQAGIGVCICDSSFSKHHSRFGAISLIQQGLNNYGKVSSLE